ncbi:MAG TPA: hypothetical protein VFM05_04620 [Candidatus Saccharimonadales bacterium]|nr:hypothetical protein [Candidatus Saccharimonadales bacterium]
MLFLIPESIFDNKRVSLLTKVFSAIAAGGLFAAGLVWFKQGLVALPERHWFKVANSVALGLLIPLNLSQQNVVSFYPQIKSQESKFKLLVDNEARSHEPGGRMWLSFGSHTIKMVPEPQDTGSKYPDIQEREYRVTYKELLYGMFGYYWPQWGLLHRVGVITLEPNVEVLIDKIDGEFDPAFLKNPPAPEVKPRTELEFHFAAKPSSRTQFLYRGADSRVGGSNHIYLPVGNYTFTASRTGCPDKKLEKRNIGVDRRPYTVTFTRLCANR